VRKDVLGTVTGNLQVNNGTDYYVGCDFSIDKSVLRNFLHRILGHAQTHFIESKHHSIGGKKKKGSVPVERLLAGVMVLGSLARRHFPFERCLSDTSDHCAVVDGRLWDVGGQLGAEHGIVRVEQIGDGAQVVAVRWNGRHVAAGSIHFRQSHWWHGVAVVGHLLVGIGGSDGCGGRSPIIRWISCVVERKWMTGLAAAFNRH